MARYERSEERKTPRNRVAPHRVEELVREDAER